MREQKRTKKINFLFLIIYLFLTSFLTFKTFKKVNYQDVKIYGSELFSKTDIVNNASWNFPSRLIFIKTKSIEKDLKKNLSLKNVSVSRQIFPFGVKVLLKTRIPIAHGEQILNGQKISGFIDKDGHFIKKEYADKTRLENLNIHVFGWKENIRYALSQIFSAQKNDQVEFLEINFASNGFLTIEEKELNTILLGFNKNLIESQLQIISSLKNQLKENNISEKIDSIDLTDPNNPKIKVFKP